MLHYDDELATSLLWIRHKWVLSPAVLNVSIHDRLIKIFGPIKDRWTDRQTDRRTDRQTDGCLMLGYVMSYADGQVCKANKKPMGLDALLI